MKTPQHRLSVEWLLTAGVLLVIASLYTLLSFLTPPAYDDWIFMAEWREATKNSSLSPGALYEFWKEIRLYDNGRLANVMSPVTSLFSPWKELFPIITGILVGVIIFLITYISAGKKRTNVFSILLVWCAALYMLPWRNFIFVADYSLNYIWASAITLLLITVIMRNERKGWNAARFLITLLLAFIAGGWHEGFAVATIAGFFLYSATKKMRFSWQWYVVGCFYTAVTLLFYYCPGMILRMEEQIGEAPSGLNYIKLAFDFLPVILSVLLIGMLFLSRRGRRNLKEAWSNPYFVISTGIVAVGVVLSLLFKHQPRSAFWPDLMAVAMLIILTKPLWIKLSLSVFRLPAKLILFALCCVPVISAVVWQSRLYKESGHILQEIETSPSGTIFYDIIPSSDIPIYTLKMPNHAAWVTPFQYHTLKEFSGKQYPAVVPTTLRYSMPEMEGQLLEGASGAFKIGNNVILPYAYCENPGVFPVDIMKTNGENVAGEAMVLPYMSHGGIPYSYIFVYFTSSEEITGIELPKIQP